MLAGQVMVGFSVSLTVTLKLQLEVFPAASVAVAVTVVVPTANAVPEAGLVVTDTPGQLSVAFTWKLTTAEHLPASLLCVMSAGQVIFGASLSTTVTLKEQLAVLPE